MPTRLEFDPAFLPCEAADGDEIFPNGLFEYNITRLMAYIEHSGRFTPEPVALDDLPYAGTSAALDENTLAAADL